MSHARRRRHTPRRNGRLNYEILDIGVEHLDEAQIEQRSLDEHPCEGGKKEVVKEGRHCDAYVVV